jgi:hypothetical protein
MGIKTVVKKILISDLPHLSLATRKRMTSRNFWYRRIFIITVKRTRWTPFFIIFIVIFYLFSLRLHGT